MRSGSRHLQDLCVCLEAGGQLWECEDRTPLCDSHVCGFCSQLPCPCATPSKPRPWMACVPHIRPHTRVCSCASAVGLPHLQQHEDTRKLEQLARRRWKARDRLDLLRLHHRLRCLGRAHQNQVPLPVVLSPLERSQPLHWHCVDASGRMVLGNSAGSPLGPCVDRRDRLRVLLACHQSLHIQSNHGVRNWGRLCILLWKVRASPRWQVKIQGRRRLSREGYRAQLKSLPPPGELVRIGVMVRRPCSGAGLATPV
mmetsp:Transcript_39223/g.113229  ORF Transcript_39223/g.113229 Transcript_39223/m.113229 type:complete len:255 (+) Transcript_39223:540-1304(+)